MPWSMQYPNTFTGQVTNQVTKNHENEFKSLYSILSNLMSGSGHSHTGNGSDGAPIRTDLTKVWTTATRPSGTDLVDRVTGYNTNFGCEEYYDLASTSWKQKSASVLGNKLWKSSNAYSVGDICYPISGSSYLRMECVVAGTSGTSEPVWTGVGTLVIDGTAKWIVDDVRDGTPVGRPVHEFASVPRSGYIAANGVLVNRVDYPRLWAYAQACGLLVVDSNWSTNNQGCFSSGDGSTTFRVPDLRAEFIRGADYSRGVDSGRAIGSWQQDQLQNITGGTDYYSYNDGGASGAFAKSVTSWAVLAGGNSPGLNWCNLSFNASRVARTGTETRPRNIALLPCIKF